MPKKENDQNRTIKNLFDCKKAINGQLSKSPF